MVRQETLKADVIRVKNKLGHAPNTSLYTEHGYHGIATLYKYLIPDEAEDDGRSKWEMVLNACGLEADYDKAKGSGRPPIPGHKLLQDFSRVAEELGHPPNYPEYQAYGSHNPNTLRYRFGGEEQAWDNVIRAAGYNPEDVPENRGMKTIKTDDVVDDFALVTIGVVIEKGDVPTSVEYRKHGKYSPNTVKEHLKVARWQDTFEKLPKKTRAFIDG